MGIWLVNGCETAEQPGRSRETGAARPDWCSRLTAMDGILSGQVREVLRAEAGSMTLWNLLWFTVFLAFAGVAIDSSNAYRVQAMLQTTADAAAHAGAIDLSDEQTARTVAMTYARANMPEDLHGVAVTTNNVTFGHWDEADRSFTPKDETALPVNAIRVVAARSEGQSNALATQILRVIGFDFWNLGAEAVVATAVNPCLRDGIVARGRIDIQSNNTAGGNFCFHGEGANDKKDVGIDLQQNNEFRCGVRVSVPSIASNLSVPSDPFAGTDASFASCSQAQVAAGVLPADTLGSGNPGLYEALSEQSIPAIGIEICNHINIVLDFVGEMPFFPADACAREDFDNPAFRVRPDWLKPAWLEDVKVYQGKGGGKKKGGGASADGGSVADFEALDLSDPANQGNVFHVKCGGKGKLSLSGRIENVAIITDCAIALKKQGGNVELSNVVLLTTDSSNKAVTLPQGAVIGTATCGERDGGVRIYSVGDITGPAQITYDGVQFVTAGSMKLAAQQSNSAGITVLAGQDVTYTANSMIGNCAAGNASAAVTTRRYAIAR